MIGISTGDGAADPGETDLSAGSFDTGTSASAYEHYSYDKLPEVFDLGYTSITFTPNGQGGYSVASATVEAGPLTHNATFVVRRVGDISEAATVNYATQHGSAVAGVDYTATSGTLNFAAGVEELVVLVAVFDEGILEFSESFSLTLTSASGAQILDGFAAAQVFDSAHVQLGELDGTTGYIIEGTQTTFEASLAVGGGGDIDGDGFDDFLVGASYWDSNGSAFLVPGGEPFTSPIDIDGTDTVALYGATNEALGYGGQVGGSVAVIGDVHGDGLADCLIGAPYDDNGGTDTGSSYLVLGSSLSGSDIDLSDLDGVDDPDGVAFLGNVAYGNFGYSVAGAGDVNNDGYDDFLIGEPFLGPVSNGGTTYLVFGGDGVADGTSFSMFNLNEGAQSWSRSPARIRTPISGRPFRRPATSTATATTTSP